MKKMKSLSRSERENNLILGGIIMTNDVLNVIKSRRSIRAYKSDEIETEKLNAVPAEKPAKRKDNYIVTV